MMRAVRLWNRLHREVVAVPLQMCHDLQCPLILEQFLIACFAIDLYFCRGSCYYS